MEFVAGPGLKIIDEIQRDPDLLLSIKERVDTDPRPGQFLLTGSARVLGLRSLPHTLVGADGDHRIVAVVPGRDRGPARLLC